MVASKQRIHRYPQILTACLALLLVVASGSSIEKRFTDLKPHFPGSAPSLKESANFTFNVNESTEGNVTNNSMAFLKGLKADSLLSKNATPCVLNAIDFYYHELNNYQVKMYYGSFDDKLFNTTALMKNVTWDLMVCTDFLYDINNYTKSQVALFNSSSAYGLAIFQHLVSNIIKMSMIYQDIQEASTVTHNTTEVWYQLGVIGNIILTVPPLEYDMYPSYSRRLLAAKERHADKGETAN
eukprot:CAMPEP_0202964822 /NCGR_PEP_ID=MMETSP1396-20130829/8916_1 /ASSEMBLY_ACC=CAM_ASM_000872 /TAXON_ID= /ORGANISM="Pseudokeronopsis sp., Strain Brazil" /LENGTH=239 /DNA_ID=CAMNT_0049687231 /DNA_START=36 /DNA_END=755 /DNA_ORIENTATION=+